MKALREVQVDAGRLRQTKWHEYAIRFAFGGAIAVVAGVVARFYGPVVGGLFLAFPAILPASATLIEKHDGKDKARADTSGAAIGAVGLLVFGLLVWVLAGRLAPVLVLLAALAGWLAVSVALWLILPDMDIRPS